MASKLTQWGDGGRLYLKKGEVTDVMSPTRCSLRLEGSGESVDANQDQLETVVPKKEGARVLVVSGRLPSLLSPSSHCEGGVHPKNWRYAEGSLWR